MEATLSLGVHVLVGSLDGNQSKESRKKERGRNGEGTKDAEDEEEGNGRPRRSHV